MTRWRNLTGTVRGGREHHGRYRLGSLVTTGSSGPTAAYRSLGVRVRTRSDLLRTDCCREADSVSITICLLLLGSCGSASRTIEVEPSIGRIVVGLVIGGISDVANRGESKGRSGWDRVAGLVQKKAWPAVALRIDGEARTGFYGWTEAALRTAAYAADWRTGGSVEYSYRLRLRGLDIRRTTRIEDGRVSLLTDVYGRLGPRGELHHARITITATETVHGTTIAATATGWSHIGDRCRLVARVAGREISRGLADALLTIERGGIDLYRSADDVIEALTRRGR